MPIWKWLIVILSALFFIFFLWQIVFRISILSFPSAGILSSPQKNNSISDLVHGYDILQAFGTTVTMIVTITGIIFAYRELRKFNIEKKAFTPLLELWTIQQYCLEIKGAEGKHIFKLNTIKINDHWSREAFNILPKDKQPIFVITNLGSGVASHIKVETGLASVDDGDKKYDFSSHSTVKEDLLYDLVPQERILIFKGDNYKNIDFSKNFIVRLTYDSDYTNEKQITKTFEAFVDTTPVKNKRIAYIRIFKDVTKKVL